MGRLAATLALAFGLGAFFPCQSAAGQTESDYRWKEGPSFLALMKGDQIVWQFNHLEDGKEKGCPYFHPLCTTRGAELTDRRPADHRWHRGLRFAWKKIDGLGGYWTWPEGLERWPEDVGTTEVTSVSIAKNADFSARFELTLTYHAPQSPPALTEHRVISVSAPDADGTYRIDWSGEFLAGPKGAFLDRTPIPGEPDGKPWGGYAGLQFRVAPRTQLASWGLQNSTGLRTHHAAGEPRSAVRSSLLKLHGKPADWMRISLRFRDGKRADVVMFDHPGNLRHPSRWHTSSMPNELIQTPLFTGPYRVAAGERFTMRYRIVIASSEIGGGEIAAEWKAFTRRP